MCRECIYSTVFGFEKNDDIFGTYYYRIICTCIPAMYMYEILYYVVVCICLCAVYIYMYVLNMSYFAIKACESLYMQYDAYNYCNSRFSIYRSIITILISIHLINHIAIYIV